MNEQIEKQAIEEMANDLMICHVEFGEDDDIRTDYDATATMLYRDKGYRKQEWISVEDRLPETREVENGVYDKDTLALIDMRRNLVSDDVLVAIKDVDKNYTFVDFDFIEDGKWRSWENGDYTVTHWMPLPEPPKMKGGAE